MALLDESPQSTRVAQLVAVAKELGALTAVSFPASNVVVDPRVRLKCQVPRCVHYGVNLMCPPSVMAVAEFAASVARYREAILLQVEIPLPERPDLGGEADLHELYTSGAYDQALTHASRTLGKIVRRVEAKALELGYPLAAGFTAGSCRLCDECVTVQSGKPCKLAFRARPAMEAMGIDVIRTAANAGVDVRLADPSSAKWTGLVLVD